MDTLIKECRIFDPCERVGLLIGCGRDAVDFATLRNHDMRRGHFLVDPNEVLAVAQTAQGRGLDLIGRFHTHPGGPCRPSVADRASLPTGWFELIAHVRVGLSQNELVALKAFDGLGRGLVLKHDAHSDMAGGVPV